MSYAPMAKKKINKAAQAMSKLAAKARMKKISPERRREIAQQAIKARWDKRAKETQSA